MEWGRDSLPPASHWQVVEQKQTRPGVIPRLLVSVLQWVERAAFLGRGIIVSWPRRDSGRDISVNVTLGPASWGRSS